MKNTCGKKYQKRKTISIYALLVRIRPKGKGLIYILGSAIEVFE